MSEATHLDDVLAAANRTSIDRTDYLLARIVVALERVADAQETIAASPCEWFSDEYAGMTIGDCLKLDADDVDSVSFKQMQVEAQRLGSARDGER